MIGGEIKDNIVMDGLSYFAIFLPFPCNITYSDKRPVLRDVIKSSICPRSLCVMMLLRAIPYVNA